MVLCVVGCQESATHNSSAMFSKSNGLKKYISQEPSVSSVRPWKSKYGEGFVLETRNYRIFTTLTDPLMLRQIPGFLESAYRAYQQQIPQNLESASLFDVYLFATRDQWENFTKDFTGDQADVYLKIKRGAYYLNGSCIAYNIGRKQTFSVLGHEGWHQFASRHFRYRLPSWLDEGIAMQFEVSQYNNGFFEFKPRENLNRIGILKLAMADNRMMGIDQIITTNPGMVIVHGDTKDSAYYYAQMYALVRFLREASHSRRLIPYNSMLNGAINGKWPIGENAARIASDRNIMMTSGHNAAISKIIFENYFGNDYQKMQNEYLYFCERITARVHVKSGK